MMAGLPDYKEITKVRVRKDMYLANSEFWGIERIVPRFELENAMIIKERGVLCAQDSNLRTNGENRETALNQLLEAELSFRNFHQNSETKPNHSEIFRRSSHSFIPDLGKLNSLAVPALDAAGRSFGARNRQNRRDTYLLHSALEPFILCLWLRGSAASVTSSDRLASCRSIS